MRLGYHGHSLHRKIQWKVKSLFNNTYDSDNESEDEPGDEYARFAADLAADLRRMKVTLPSRGKHKRSEKSKQNEPHASEWIQKHYTSTETPSPAPSHDTETSDCTLVDDLYSKTACHELYCPLPGVNYSPTWKMSDLVVQSEKKPSTQYFYGDGRREYATASRHSDYTTPSQYLAHRVPVEDPLEVSEILSSNRTLSPWSNSSSDCSSHHCGTAPNDLLNIQDTAPGRTWSFTSGLADVLDLHPLATRAKAKPRAVDRVHKFKSKPSFPLIGPGLQPVCGTEGAPKAEILVEDKSMGGIQRYRGVRRNRDTETILHDYAGLTVCPCEHRKNKHTWKSVLKQTEHSFPLAELHGDGSCAEANVGPTIRLCDELEQLNTWKPTLKEPEELYHLAELPGDNDCATTSDDGVSTLVPPMVSSLTKQNFGDVDPGVEYSTSQPYGHTPVPPVLPPLKFVPSAGITYRIHQTALRPRLAPLTAPQIYTYEKKLAPETPENFERIPVARKGVRPAVESTPKLDAGLLRGSLSNIAHHNVQNTSGASSERRSSSSNSHNSTGKGTKEPRGSASGSNQRNKRRKIDDHTGDQEEVSDSDSQERRKKNDMPNPHKNPQSRRLKCPYYQRRPEECPLASCRGQGFTEMAKLKDHLKRVHVQPLRCTRCWEEVQIYDQHFRQDAICSKREEPYDRRISPLKLREIRFNRAPFTKDQSAEEKWAILYRILFPDAEVVPSPYEQNDIGTQMEKLLVMSLEEEITKELGDVLGNIIHIIRQRLPGIVARCRNKARRLSEESLQDLSTSPPTPTTISNSGAESIFDKSSGLGPSSTTLDTDVELPVFPRDAWVEQNDTNDFLNCNETMDCFAGSNNEFGAAREWEPNDSWGSIFQFSNS